MATANPTKDTIYIDVDDEITGIIDKLRTSEAKLVVLVLPKRASVFQSIVNMKLLKRAADEDKKHLVLITTETGLLPLAGLAGVLVAPSLTGKPAVPMAPQAADDREETVDEGTGDTTTDTPLDKTKPVGELAGLPATAPLLAVDGVETIEMEDEADLPELAAVAAAAPQAKSKKDKKLAVPNFERFRLLLVLGVVVVIALIGGTVYAVTVLPKATIAIKTDATNVNTNLNFTADSQANTFDAQKHILPAKLVSQQKVYTQQAPATGQQNNGVKATGSVTMTAQACGSVSSADDVPAGTGVSTSGLTYITQSTVSFSPTKVKNGCIYYTADSKTDIIAQSAGATYNTGSGVSFTVSGRTDVTASGSADGGTDDITKVVTQADIDNAKAAIKLDDAAIKQALAAQLVQSGLYSIDATFSSGNPAVTNSAQAGDTANTVTVNETVNYSMLGVQQTDIKALIDESAKEQINTAKQSIIDEGLRDAAVTVTSNSDGKAQMALQTVAVAGPQLSIDSLKKLAAGKKSGEIRATLQAIPGVTDVTIKLSPFFVSHVPTKQDKITVTIAKPNITATKSTNGSKP